MKTDDIARHNARGEPTGTVRLVVTDMDGTLLTPEKQVTHATLDAMAKLRARGVPVCLVSSRAPHGITMYFDALKIRTPYAGLNGAVIFDADGNMISSLCLEAGAVRAAVDMFDVHEVDSWLFCGNDWIVRDASAGYVPHEKRVIRTTPHEVKDFTPWEGKVGKLTGSSADYDLLERMEGEIGQMLEGQASVARSAPYYLDITPPEANKGHALRELGRLLHVPVEEIACIGDMRNDIPMLAVAGLAIAMGNASDEVASYAHVQTDTNEADGWAKAMEEFVLPRVPAAGA
ncbi:Cof-type HAD-IIB family hydrolase [Acetobacter musti]|uniref:Cof-type HAD-IIB family hydrolase n=1 Tax=Acetobacter musti TaxID=864732 RepID=A0ABX0JPE5_9PROT|nr:Cof-type HAD-IIB family hydrolase [Acetobacter musti]NHN85286.1 Cof-type HAD-IIB family hydrolase [Acetobacter musti]